MASLAASLILAAPAQAGTYSVPAYTGGTITDTANGWHLDNPFAYSSSSQVYEGSATGNCTTDSSGNTTSAKMTASGSLSAKFSWQPAFSGEPAPTAVIVCRNCVVTVYSQAHSSQSTVGGSCSDGLGGSQSGCPSSSNSTNYMAGTVGGDGSVSASCTASAVFTASSGTGSAVGRADASYTASVYPVTVNITGTNNPAIGDFRALTGQQITATLSSIPSGFKVTKFTWNQPSATCFKNYDYTLPSNQLAPLGSTDLTGPAAGSTSVAALKFYDSAAENLTVTCAVTMTAPDGLTVLNVAATSPTINVLKPTAYWTTNSDDPNSGPAYNLTPTGYIGYIEQWDANITVPAPFSGGSGCFAQIVYPTIDFQRTPTGTQPINCYLKEIQTNANGTTSWVLPQTGLDTMFPYPVGPSTNPQSSSAYQNYPNGYMWDVSVPGKSVDTPSVGFGIAASDNGGNNWYDAFDGDSFTTWLMYKPTGGVWVPLQRVDWSWTGHVVKDKATGMWNSATSGTQPVTGNTSNQGAGTNTPPQWTTVNMGASVLRP